MLDASYVLPIRRTGFDATEAEDLASYLRRLSPLVEVIVVDGSPQDVFARHAAAWGDAVALHRAPDADLHFAMGKVNGVVTGLGLASHERVVIADDDVRYDEDTLRRTIGLLDDAEVVRPQNWFDPLPWHALWDTGRTLLNRMTGGDWPGTLAVRRSVLLDVGGYDGDVMFENLELVRTVAAAGGREIVPLDVLVLRRPPSTDHFLRQRVRQAFDEFARPARLVLFLAIAPATGFALVTGRWREVVSVALGTVALAEAGRRRGGGTRVFPFRASLLAPCWVAERAVTSWLAVVERLRFGGVRYGGGVVPRAATPVRELRRRVAAVPARR